MTRERVVVEPREEPRKMRLVRLVRLIGPLERGQVIRPIYAEELEP